MGTEYRLPARAMRWLICLAALALGTGAAPAFADAAAASATADGAGETVITAAKRETSVLKTPIAITAISSQVMARNRVTDAVALNALVLATKEGFKRNGAIRDAGFDVPQLGKLTGDGTRLMPS